MNPFDSSEAYLRRLVAGVWELGSTQVPTLAKSSGRGKLLGEWFVPGLLESMDRAVAGSTFHDLVLLTTLLRAEVVMRDHLDDEWLSVSELECLRDALATLQAEIATRLRQIGHSALNRWRAAHRVSANAFDRFDRIGYANAVVGKNIVVQVPVHVVALLTGAQRRQRTVASTFISHYLWALQMVDDWQDRAHDASARVNHNLFTVDRLGALINPPARRDSMPLKVTREVHRRLFCYQYVESPVIRSFVVNGVRQLQRITQFQDTDLSIDRFHARCDLI